MWPEALVVIYLVLLGLFIWAWVRWMNYMTRNDDPDQEDKS